ncbi:LutC/YkgG family protein [Singulisphaera sp. PoT]|uniref:LutC/YkgG family protein n=1 Tax=Singulisphaera sp. PoT TaxID=3411797 RepID=UPI003BF490E6
MSDAKSEILSRVRSALKDVPATETPADVTVSRDYRLKSDLDRQTLIDQFIERVEDYRAVVHRVTPEGLSEAIESACARKGVKRLLIPADLPQGWIPKNVETVQDQQLTYEQIDTTDGVLTGSAIGVAQTGTIMLDGGPGQGRRAISLIPDYHLCVVLEDDVVGLIPEAITRLRDVAQAPGRPITWISGPSATSDIELNRVEGVHGPRTLEVLVVGPAR